MSVRFRFVFVIFYYFSILVYGYVGYLKGKYSGDSVYLAICFVAVAVQTLTFLNSSRLHMPYITVSPKFKAFSAVYLVFINVLFALAFVVLFL